MGMLVMDSVLLCVKSASSLENIRGLITESRSRMSITARIGMQC